MSYKDNNIKIISLYINIFLKKYHTITADSSENERYEILKDEIIDIIKISSLQIRESGINTEKIKCIDGKEGKREIKDKARELGVIGRFLNSDIHIPFYFSGNNFDESVNKQINEAGKEGQIRFAKMLPCFKEVVTNARLLEVHKERYKDTKYYDPDLENMYVLISGFESGEYIIPVKLEIKEYSVKENGLYVAITYPEIEKASVIHAVEVKNESSPLTADRALSTYKLASLLKEVKTKQGYKSIAKYVPKKFTKENEEISIFPDNTENIGILLDLIFEDYFSDGMTIELCAG
ncbi:MAG: hypothetical protein IJ796_00555 [Lachnospiraceae bacterium]|nr:hypothetical protein [Lachnospiraceae bacterium]